MPVVFNHNTQVATRLFHAIRERQLQRGRFAITHAVKSRKIVSPWREPLRLNRNLFGGDQATADHFAQPRQCSRDHFLGINEFDHQREFAARVH